MTKQSLRPLFAAALALVCVGCATYASPPVGAPAAELTLLFSGGVTNLFAKKSQYCRQELGAQIAVQGQLWDNTNEPVRLIPAQRLYIEASSIVTDYRGAGVMCGNVISFVPEVGHSYTFFHEVERRACSVRLRDSGTGREPESFVAHEYPERC